MRHFYFLIVGLAILYSCSGASDSKMDNVIDIESAVGTGKIRNASEFIKSIKYIPLETTPGSMVGNIIDIIINNNKIYVRDDKNVIKVFDLNGRYLQTFDRQGRGPEEYISFIDFEMTPDGHIFIASMNDAIVEYGSDFKFIRKITPDKGQDVGFIDLIIVKKGVFASNIFSFNIDGLKMSWKIYDDSLNTLFSLNDEPLPIQLSSSGSGEVRAVGTTSRMNRRQSYMFNNDFIMFNPENDTIFNIDYENNYLKSDRYIINYGKYRYSEEIESRQSEVEAISLNSLIEIDNYLYLAFDFRKLAPEPFEREASTNRPISSSTISSGSATTTTTMSVGMGGGTVTTVNAIYNKRNGELSLLNQPIPRTLGLKNDINNGATFWPRSTTGKQELISWHNAFDLVLLAEEGKIDQSIVANLKEDDNPVVVIAVPK